MQSITPFQGKARSYAKRGIMRFVYVFFLIGLLSGCTPKPSAPVPSEWYTEKGSKVNPHKTKYIKDGAPPGPIPVFFRKVIPKNEPFSHYGNPQSYAVAGRTYQVMKSSGGYKVRGIASWYGTKFHQQRTSSGDKYDMYALTAAHRTLPLPTYVKVKNLNNGREVVVKINDRGPFHSNRIIDLSYAAAAKLGIFPQGTAPVEIEALTKGNYVASHYIQAGAFNSKSLAMQLQRKITRLTSAPVHIERYSQRYVVKVGPFANKRLSDNFQTKLAANGIKGAFSVLY